MKKSIFFAFAGLMLWSCGTIGSKYAPSTAGWVAPAADKIDSFKVKKFPLGKFDSLYVYTKRITFEEAIPFSGDVKFTLDTSKVFKGKFVFENKHLYKKITFNIMRGWSRLY